MITNVEINTWVSVHVPLTVQGGERQTATHLPHVPQLCSQETGSEQNKTKQNKKTKPNRNNPCFSLTKSNFIAINTILKYLDQY